MPTPISIERLLLSFVDDVVVIVDVDVDVGGGGGGVCVCGGNINCVPCKSLVKTSCGTLQPHPRSVENFVSRKFLSKL